MLKSQEAVQKAAWIARDLGLLPRRKLNQLFNKTIDSMTKEDVENLSKAMVKFSVLLAGEAVRRA